MLSDAALKNKIMKNEFKQYLEDARKDFTKVAAKYTISEHLELRTAIDDILIAYDQAVECVLNNKINEIRTIIKKNKNDI